MTHEWTFPVRLDRVVDGDTLDLVCDMGFRVTSHQRVRLRGVDTAEVYGVTRTSEEYAAGRAHSEFVSEWLSGGEGEYPYTLRTEKRTGKYGRWLGNIYCPRRDQWLTDALAEAFPEVVDDD